MLGAQATLLTNILSRDGNCIARINWIESKVQNGSGSVVEKLQTASEKIENFLKSG